MSDDQKPPEATDEADVEPTSPRAPDKPITPRNYDDPVDDASDDSFPASDPPSFTDSSATRNRGDR